MTLHSIPRLAGKARLRRDRRREGEDGYLLLFPESGLSLNGTARAILAQCTGEQTVAQIIDRLVGDYGEASRDRIARDVAAFLRTMRTRGLIEDLLRGAA